MCDAERGPLSRLHAAMQRSVLTALLVALLACAACAPAAAFPYALGSDQLMDSLELQVRADAATPLVAAADYILDAPHDIWKATIDQLDTTNFNRPFNWSNTITREPRTESTSDRSELFDHSGRKPMTPTAHSCPHPVCPPVRFSPDPLEGFKLSAFNEIGPGRKAHDIFVHRCNVHTPMKLFVMDASQNASRARLNAAPFNLEIPDTTSWYGLTSRTVPEDAQSPLKQFLDKFCDVLGKQGYAGWRNPWDKDEIMLCAAAGSFVSCSNGQVCSGAGLDASVSVDKSKQYFIGTAADSGETSSDRFGVVIMETQYDEAKADAGFDVKNDADKAAAVQQSVCVEYADKDAMDAAIAASIKARAAADAAAAPPKKKRLALQPPPRKPASVAPVIVAHVPAATPVAPAATPAAAPAATPAAPAAAVATLKKRLALQPPPRKPAPPPSVAPAIAAPVPASVTPAAAADATPQIEPVVVKKRLALQPLPRKPAPAPAAAALTSVAAAPAVAPVAVAAAPASAPAVQPAAAVTPAVAPAAAPTTPVAPVAVAPAVAAAAPAAAPVVTPAAAPAPPAAAAGATLKKRLALQPLPRKPAPAPAAAAPTPVAAPAPAVAPVAVAATPRFAAALEKDGALQPQ